MWRFTRAKESGQPSRTSILVAAARAFGSHDPDPSVRNPDWLAEHLIGQDELELLGGHPIRTALLQDYREACRDQRVSGTSMMMMVRTRFIDERLSRAIGSGASQVVVLGAGFDSRAYRFRELLKDATVFEVDSAPTQELKQRRVQAVWGAPPANVVYVPIDFNHEDLGEVMHKAGYQPGAKTFFTWEGVSMYVAEEGVREMLRTLATQSARGSTLVMDYITKHALEFMEKNPDAPGLKYLESWNEPRVFGLPDGREREFFAELGLEPVEIIALFSRETMMRYAMRKDGTVIGMVPGMPRPARPPIAVPVGRSDSFYSLAELLVP